MSINIVEFNKINGNQTNIVTFIHFTKIKTSDSNIVESNKINGNQTNIATFIHFTKIKMSDSEMRGQEEAACMHVFRPM